MYALIYTAIILITTTCFYVIHIAYKWDKLRYRLEIKTDNTIKQVTIWLEDNKSYAVIAQSQAEIIKRYQNAEIDKLYKGD
jgi:archaellum biogenesis protein FlaJ (TadC family)